MYRARSSSDNSSKLTVMVLVTAWLRSSAFFASNTVSPLRSNAPFTYTSAAAMGCWRRWTRSRRTPLTSVRSSGHSPSRVASCTKASSSTRGNPARRSSTASTSRIASTLTCCVSGRRVVLLRVVIKRAQFGPPCRKGRRWALFHTSSITSKMRRSPSTSPRRAVAASTLAKAGRSPVSISMRSSTRVVRSPGWSPSVTHKMPSRYSFLTRGSWQTARANVVLP